MKEEGVTIQIVDNTYLDHSYHHDDSHQSLLPTTSINCDYL